MRRLKMRQQFADDRVEPSRMNREHAGDFPRHPGALVTAKFASYWFDLPDGDIFQNRLRWSAACELARFEGRN